MAAFTLLLFPLSLGLASHSLIYVRLKRYGCILPSYFSPYVHKKLSVLFPRKEKKDDHTGDQTSHTGNRRMK